MADLIEVEQARAVVLGSVDVLPREAVALQEGLGRVLAEPLASAGDVPPFDSSAMDGYAVLAGPPAELRVVDESRAGRPAGRALGAGDAIAISTGAQVPAGERVAVVPVELVEERGRSVAVPATEPGANVRRAGEDIPAGRTVVEAGTVLGPAELAVAASVGCEEVPCGARPTVAVLVTGDELVAPGEPLGPGQIRDSNAIALAAQATAAGAEVVERTIVPDELDSTVASLTAALERADVVCVSGGVSVGPHDHVKPALRRLGVEERFWGVRLKPGKPTWFGVHDRGLVFGLPGNPVSAMVTFHLFARAALRALAGADPRETRTTALLSEAVERHGSREQAVRCRLSAGEDGWHAQPNGAQDSHILTSMVGAGGLALVPAGVGEIPAGTSVEVELLPAW